MARLRLLFLLLPVLAGHAAVAGASPFADLAAIDRAVAQFTGAPAGMPGGAITPVDPRLRLATCRQSLALAWRTPARDAVRVDCPDPGSWHVFVAVQVAGAGPIAVARGEALTLSVAGDGFDVSQPAEALDAGSVGDWIRVRPLREGNNNSSALTAIRARIVRPGLAEVPLP